MEMSQIWAVLAATLSTLVLGRIWYSPILFRDAWQSTRGLSVEEAKAQNKPNLKIIGSGVVIWLLTALVFSMFLGPDPEMGFAVGAGFSAGLCWVASSLGVTYLFERRPMKLFLINGGFQTIQFTLYGVILGAM